MIFRRMLFLVTSPVWILVFCLAAIQSAVHSTWIWIMTGTWLLSSEYHQTWMDRLADRFEEWLRQQVTA